ncbi:MAG: polysaccharide deacetylase family protein [Pirellulales bacterium]|nr:polysaccharide deacetylase family protein [Pirellulales bacterium]
MMQNPTISICLMALLSITALLKSTACSEEYKSGTRRLLGVEPLRTPEQTVRDIGVRKGFKAELVAAEPMTMDPIDLAWGPDGRMWVVEMADYPLGIDGKGKPGGRIRYLQDTDGDGRYDKSTVFLDSLAYPTGVMPWRKGVLVTCAPEVFYAEDTDGDGKADLRRTLYKGFGEGNQQHRVNYPSWGLDNWVYLANGDGGGGAGGSVRSVKTDKTFEIRGRDIRIRPDDGDLDVVTGQAQFGRCRDDWGNWFGCNNRNPGWHYALVDHYLRRNPYIAAPPGRITLCPNDQPIPLGRVISYRLPGYKIPEPGTFRGRYTSVGGLAVYRDDLFGPEFIGNLFTSDSVFNVTHRMIVSPDGATFRGERAKDERGSEFFASIDPWFRNCGIRTGPDGALYITGMYRMSIEHPEWIDDEVEHLLDLRVGDNMGRIVRVYPTGKQPRPIPRLDRLDTAGLVAALDSPSGWQRDMAQQMIVWCGDKNAVKPLEQMALGNHRPLARLHALCTLDGLGSLRAEVVDKALADRHPGIRRHAIRLSESLLNANPSLGEKMLRLIDDPDQQIQMQLAYSLGQWKDPRAGQTLGRLALRHAERPYLLSAVLSSAVDHIVAMSAVLKNESEKTPAQKNLAGVLAQLKTDIEEYPNLTAELEAARNTPSVAETNATLTNETTAERQAALEKFKPALTMQGDMGRGRNVFEDATCADCHRMGDVGTEIGPDIETLTDRSPEIMWVAVIDPNRTVKQRYVQYTAVTADGLTVQGMITEETSNSITLVDVAGKSHIILRKDLEELIRGNISHMPEGLEGKLSLQQMADLFAFLDQRTLPAYRQLPGNHPELVSPLADGTFKLLPSQAEVYANGVTMRSDYMIWRADKADDHVTWSVDVIKPGRYEVWLRWAQINEYAGNPFAVEVKGDSPGITASLPGTGGWKTPREQRFGTLMLDGGHQRIVIRGDGAIKTELGDIYEVRLVPASLHRRPAPKHIATGGHARALSDEANRVQGSVLKPAADGVLHLTAEACQPSGTGLEYSPEKKAYGPFGFGLWPRVVWMIETPRAATYAISLKWSVPEKWVGNPFVIEVGEKRFEGKIASSGGENKWAGRAYGTIELPTGRQRVLFRPDQTNRGALGHLREICLTPVATVPNSSREGGTGCLSASAVLKSLKTLADKQPVPPGVVQDVSNKTLLPIPDGLVVLTFDDGTKTDITNVAPLLKQYGFGASFYITENYKRGMQHYMNWADVRKLNEMGFEVGNHTSRHRDASRQSAAEFKADVEQIEKSFREHGLPAPKTFCYPGYLHGPVAVGVLKEKGYLFARRGTFPEGPYARDGARGPLYDPQEDHPLLIPTTAAAGPACGPDEICKAIDSAKNGKIAVLTFHGVPDTAGAPHVNTSLEDFKRVLNHLRDKKCTVIALRDLIRYVDPKKMPADPYEPIQRRLTSH